MWRRIGAASFSRGSARATRASCRHVRNLGAIGEMAQRRAGPRSEIRSGSPRHPPGREARRGQSRVSVRGTGSRLSSVQSGADSSRDPGQVPAAAKARDSAHAPSGWVSPDLMATRLCERREQCDLFLGAIGSRSLLVSFPASHRRNCRSLGGVRQNPLCGNDLHF